MAVWVWCSNSIPMSLYLTSYAPTNVSNLRRSATATILTTVSFTRLVSIKVAVSNSAAISRMAEFTWAPTTEGQDGKKRSAPSDEPVASALSGPKHFETSEFSARTCLTSSSFTKQLAVSLYLPQKALKS